MNRVILIAICLLAVAIPAEAGPLKKLIGRLKPHAAAQQQSKASCPCNNAACTGKPGCACGEAGCTCNGPTQVAKQDQPRATVKQRSLLRRAAGRTDPPQSPAAPLEQAPAAPAGPEEKAVKKSASVDLSPDEAGMLSDLTAFRKRHGLPAMTVDPLLQRLARKRVTVFSHRAFKMWSWEHAHSWGFPGPCLNTTVTDDLASGVPADDAIRAWADTTDGHADQMLGKAKMNGRWQDCHFNLCGVAHQGANSIAIFGRREN